MEMRPFLRKNLSDTVKAELYDYIDNLDLEKGTKLPPENTIAQNYGVSRVTVRRALDELEQEGVIIRIHGRGTFVNPQAKQFKINLGVSQELGRLVDQSGYEMRICLKAVEKLIGDIIVAKALGIPSESAVICAERAYYADGHLAIVCQDYVAGDIFSEPVSREDWERNSTYDVVRTKAGKLAIRDWIQLKTVAASEVKTLSGVETEFESSSVLEFYGLVYGQDNQPLIYGRTYYNTDYIRFNLVRNIIAF
ncbi:MAG: GntR family transcriptional regulator [Clostridium sp.]|nr:GntR family transcriptional regulator [Clostridium sp.]